MNPALDPLSFIPEVDDHGRCPTTVGHNHQFDPVAWRYARANDVAGVKWGER
jgi:hypothetical protein